MKGPSKTSTHQPKFLSILDPKRQQVFKNLSFLSTRNIYLAGGTSLAFYLNHRTSVDFDFYTPNKFPKTTFVKSIVDHLEKHRFQTEITRDLEDTFDLEIEKIHISCFYYPYELIRNLNKLEGVTIASIEDISAMKLLAIAQRGTYRDFIDIYYLFEKFDLPKMLVWTKEKYPNISYFMMLKGLIYFEDAEKSLGYEQKRVRLLDKTLTWKKVKDYIKKTVIDYQRSFLKE